MCVCENTLQHSSTYAHTPLFPTLRSNNSKLREKGKKDEGRRLREFVDAAYKYDPRVARKKEDDRLERERRKAEKEEARRRVLEEEEARKAAAEAAKRWVGCGTEAFGGAAATRRGSRAGWGRGEGARERGAWAFLQTVRGGRC